MFAIFNLGAQELVILLLMAVFLLGVPLVIVVLVLFLVRGSAQARRSSPLADLREEVERLREEVERLKKGRSEQITPADRPRE